MAKVTIIKTEKTAGESKQATGNESGSAISPKYSFETLASLSEMNTYHLRAMWFKAMATISGGVSVYDPKDPERKPDENADRIAEFINNSLEDLQNFQFDDEVLGNAFLEVIRSRGGEVAGVKHIPGVECQLKRISGQINLFQKVNSKEVEFIPFTKAREDKTKGEFIHQKNYCMSNRFYGVPKYIGALASLNLDRNSITYNIKKFENNCIPDAIITVTGTDLDKASEENIANFYRDNYKGVDNAGRVLLITNEVKEGTIKVEKLNDDLKEASYRLLRQDSKEEVLVAHEVPPILLGVQSAGRLGQGMELRDQIKSFNRFVIRPRQERLEKILNQIIADGMNIEGWKVKFDQFDFIDSKADADFYQKMVQTTDANGETIIDSAEARQELGYPARETKVKKSRESNLEAIVNGLTIIRKQIEA